MAAKLTNLAHHMIADTVSALLSATAKAGYAS
jgi:hypothetical protein